MLAMRIIYRISLATPGCKAPEHVDLVEMPESRYEVETVVLGYHVYTGESGTQLLEKRLSVSWRAKTYTTPTLLLLSKEAR